MKRGYAAIGLDNPKDKHNVGSVLRAAMCYNVALVVSSGHRYKKAPTDTLKGYRHIPFLQGMESVLNHIPYDCVPIAVDLLPDAKSLTTFNHPERAFYIFGAEDATLGERITSKCKYKIFIPTTFCMNLAATVNVVLYDRLAKEER